MNLDPRDPPLRVADAAKALNVSDDTIYRAITSGEIKALRLGATLRIPVAEIRRLLALPDAPSVAETATEIASVVGGAAENTKWREAVTMTMSLLENWWPAALAGNPEAMTMVIRLLERLRDLHGLTSDE